MATAPRCNAFNAFRRVQLAQATLSVNLAFQDSTSITQMGHASVTVQMAIITTIRHLLVVCAPIIAQLVQMQ